MAWFVEWTVFTAIAAFLLYQGYTLFNPGEKMLRFGTSLIFWIASISQWITDHPGGSIIPLLALIAPLFMSLTWLLQSLGAYTDKPLKRNIYE